MGTLLDGNPAARTTYIERLFDVVRSIDETLYKSLIHKDIKYGPERSLEEFLRETAERVVLFENEIIDRLRDSPAMPEPIEIELEDEIPTDELVFRFWNPGGGEEPLAEITCKDPEARPNFVRDGIHDVISAAWIPDLRRIVEDTIYDLEQKREEIEEVKEEIESYGFFIKKINPDNIWEVDEEEFNEVLKGLDTGLIEQIKKWEIPLFYSELVSFYPFLEHETEDFFEFLQNYKEEMRGWYERELDLFEDYEEAETIYHVYCELFDMEEEEIASWYDNELDTLSWRTVYLAKTNGTVFLRDVGGYGRDDIAIIDPETDITDIVERLKGGERLHKILNDCYD